MELQGLAAPGSLRRYLDGLRDGRAESATGTVGTASRLHCGVAKSGRHTTDLETSPVVTRKKQAHQPPVLAARSAFRAGGESALRPSRP